MAQKIDCDICALPATGLWYPFRCCDMNFCHDCLINWFKTCITSMKLPITCPSCPMVLSFYAVNLVLSLYNKDLAEKHAEFLLRRYLLTVPDVRYCPAPDCGYAVIAPNCANCPKLQCQKPECSKEFCFNCDCVWEEGHKCKRPEKTKKGVKHCPHCRSPTVKADDGTCNKVTCSLCKVQFCWLCLEEASEFHFVQWRGCTFWGKKKWSKKKTLFCQIGALITAPIGIAALAIVSLPAITIAVPVAVAKKSKGLFQKDSKVKRTLKATGLVAGSMVVSPIVATASVGIAVPVLFIYTYTVIPMSMFNSTTLFERMAEVL